MENKLFEFFFPDANCFLFAYFLMQTGFYLEAGNIFVPKQKQEKHEQGSWDNIWYSEVCTKILICEIHVPCRCL